MHTRKQRSGTSGLGSLALAAVCAVQIGFAQAAPIDSAKSSVAATFTQIGVDVTANFTRVEGSIDFDPAHPEAGKAQIAVPLSSFDLGDPEYNKEVEKKEWFDSARFPQATFASSSITSGGDGKLIVQGKLTIKGKALDVSLPVVVARDGNTETFTGQLPIKRLYFGIGEGEWSDTDTLADKVVVKFKIVTSP